MERREFVHGIVAAGALTTVGALEWPHAAHELAKPGVTRIDADWKFLRNDAPGAEQPSFDAAAWQTVQLPHTARIEALVTGPIGTPTAQWQGICWYRRVVRVEPGAAGEKVFLKFDGAMNVAQIWLDGAKIGEHLGGYLPFVLDISERVRPGADHVLAVRLDNHDNPITGPKPLAQLDFNMYHGLYRSVYLTRKNPLHITDPILANRAASGGVFVTYPSVTRNAATVRVQTHVRNDARRARAFRVQAILLSGSNVVARSESPSVTQQPATDGIVTNELTVTTPALWSPSAPNLHTLRVDVIDAAGVSDTETLRIGIRRIEIGANGFLINGERMFLRGTNRHQEYPYIGYALSDAAQHRDALKIKEAGFDYIRLSHYAHSPAFMAACDELGLVVMNCIPGWQYFNRDPAFVELQYQNCRDLIRRDRNHASVIMWEVSLNESDMPPDFIAKTHAIAHEEYPGDQCYTAGWVKGYDVFIQARQHGGCRQEKEGSCVVSEYGDWEYYAMTAGLNQHEWQQLTPAQSNSRQLRWQGERALLQQASNFQEAHNDNRATIAFADGLWVMYDYNRGYAPDIESSGCMDIFRLPKFSYYFFQSQRDAREQLANVASGPMVFIASHWTRESDRDVRVFSNCEEVALSLNGRLLQRRGPDKNRMTTHLAHPPFTFKTSKFTAGTLEAVGFVEGREVARHQVRTPGSIAQLRLTFDRSGRAVEASAKDHLFCYAALEDSNGTVVPDAWHNIAYGVTGAANLVGLNPLATEAGISSILVETRDSKPQIAVYGLALIPGRNATRIVSGVAALQGRAAAHEIRFTSDGSEPGPRSSRYVSPIARANIRAGLFANGEMLVTLAQDAPKFRVPISAPPDKRTPFGGHQ